jgi:hypothetical protein
MWAVIDSAREQAVQGLKVLFLQLESIITHFIYVYNQEVMLTDTQKTMMAMANRPAGLTKPTR